MSQDKSKIYISESIKDLVDIESIPSIEKVKLHVLYDNRMTSLLKFRRDVIPSGYCNFTQSFSFLITNEEALEYLKNGMFKSIMLCFGTEKRKITPTAPIELELTDDNMYICTVST